MTESSTCCMSSAGNGHFLPCQTVAKITKFADYLLKLTNYLRIPIRGAVLAALGARIRIK